MTKIGHDSLATRLNLNINGKNYAYYSLPTYQKKSGNDISTLPFCLKVLLENLLRFENGKAVKTSDIEAIAKRANKGNHQTDEIAYHPARVLMQDFTGVPAVADLAAMRQAMKDIGADPKKINPLTPVDLVIDHSVVIDFFGTDKSFQQNVDVEFERNQERYEFLRWGQEAFDNFRVVPPGTGICHQVNLEYLARVVWSSKDENGEMVAFPDTVVGTDSHTTMVNGLGVLGWGVGGIEAEAAMLGQSISMLIPDVIGFELKGTMRAGTNATDLVLRVVEMLRQKGVVGKFVEFYGDGIKNLTLAERATIANMAPEYGATCGIFPTDEETLNYLRLTGRDDDTIMLVEQYMKAQGMFYDDNTKSANYTDSLSLELDSVVPSVAGPKRPQDRIALPQLASVMRDNLAAENVTVADDDALRNQLCDGSVVIAAITSCTNTSNPSVLIAAGLVARNAVKKGLKPKSWVKTSLAPGSQVVTDYLEKAGLMSDLNALGFNLVGYGCTTCIGNSGPLPEQVSNKVDNDKLHVCSVLSGNRNFEGRISGQVRSNFLASPPLVVAYALLGTVLLDIDSVSLGDDSDGNPVYLKDIWPDNHEINAIINETVNADLFNKRYADVFLGTKQWQDVDVKPSELFDWRDDSTYVRMPPFVENLQKNPTTTKDIINAKPLLILGDSITTDHISPAGAFKSETPAGQYLSGNGVDIKDFNSYGARRGNHEVMMRGTFANVRIKNKMVPDSEGGVSHYNGEVMSVYDAALKHADDGTDLIVLAGKEYGTGSSRDWAAKGTRLLGVRAVITESFERIHRSNLIGMGVLPLQFTGGDNADSLNFDGTESFTIKNIADLQPSQTVMMTATRANGETFDVSLLCRIDTADEMNYFNHGGILSYVLRHLAA
ncbi:MAG: aconitate hydratase AcnA [Alphaproteobacteria bacterium]|nr:aconitate hydratase AcnA [Alphaproteobacteria bacterium]